MKKIIFILVILITSGFTLVNRIDELIKKEIKSTFNIESYSIKNIKVSSEMNESLPLKITNENLFKIIDNNKVLGYYYLGKAYGKADYFDFLVIFDADLIVSKVTVLVYREDHGGEVGSKRWLKQFSGTPSNKTLVYQNDIVGISGATISVKSMTNEVNKLLKTVDILNTKNQL
ncbi:FMN-binding protein [Lutibacter sp. HS1-25]|uniref:FMN-binding protein n=1 Tax=Lutibacter sp. HS1-25 TaxID=2485000 RepID=UPI001012486D|nr:FMN-binding protein [Lutibacter sp. HS1-25]RXP57036.1 FMN-binding protein [Lutibacter sp. HS1-25]